MIIIESGADAIAIHLLFLLFFSFLLGRRSSNSNRIGMKFGRILLPVFDCQGRISNMMSFFQDGGHDVRPPLANAYAAASAGCSLALR